MPINRTVRWRIAIKQTPNSLFNARVSGIIAQWKASLCLGLLRYPSVIYPPVYYLIWNLWDSLNFLTKFKTLCRRGTVLCCDLKCLNTFCDLPFARDKVNKPSKIACACSVCTIGIWFVQHIYIKRLFVALISLLVSYFVSHAKH